MVRSKDGHWVAAIRLSPGEYRFTYVADGERYCDFASFGIEYSPSGPLSVLRIVPDDACCPSQTAREIYNTMIRAIDYDTPMPRVGPYPREAEEACREAVEGCPVDAIKLIT